MLQNSILGDFRGELLILISHILLSWNAFMSLCLSLSLSCLSLSLSVSFCLFLSLSVSFCLFLSLSVSFCLFLSLSVSFCLFLSRSFFLSVSLSLPVTLWLSLSSSQRLTKEKLSTTCCGFLIDSMSVDFHQNLQLAHFHWKQKLYSGWTKADNFKTKTRVFLIIMLG